MTFRKLTLLALSLLWMTAAGAGMSTAATTADDLPLNKVRLPPGFEISLFARVTNARSMTLSPNGTLFVGTRTAGNVYAIQTRAQDRTPITIAQGLNMPNGVAFKDGALYVAEVNRLLRYDDIESKLKQPPKPAVVTDKFPER